MLPPVETEPKASDLNVLPELIPYLLEISRPLDPYSQALLILKNL